jgi:hypothetical protein
LILEILAPSDPAYPPYRRSIGRLQAHHFQASKDTTSTEHNNDSTIAIMAEPEVATKAPEIDAMEDQAQPPTTASLIPGDTPAQTGASLGVRGSSLQTPTIADFKRNIAQRIDQLVSIPVIDSYTAQPRYKDFINGPSNAQDILSDSDSNCSNFLNDWDSNRSVRLVQISWERDEYWHPCSEVELSTTGHEG